MHLFNGQVPIRKKGDFKYWSGTIPGNTSETLWTTNHPYADLPRVVDPPSGWLQNTNDPPGRRRFPARSHRINIPPTWHRAARWTWRSQRSAKMLLEDEKISFDELMQYKHSTQVELADRLLDDLIPVARQGSDEARRAAEVLATWDRKVDADSRGAVLFAFWKQAMDADRLFAKPWREDAPLTTPDGLANPAEAVRVLEATATKVEVTYGALDVAWGEVFRLPGAANLPANGGDGDLGVFRSVWFAPGKDNRFQAVAGDFFVAAIEFSNPVKAMALNSYGNATQPGSPHAGRSVAALCSQGIAPCMAIAIGN